MDYRSLYLHFECGIYMKDTDVIEDIKQDINEAIKVSHKETLEETKYGIVKSMWQAILRIFAPLM